MRAAGAAGALMVAFSFSLSLSLSGYIVHLRTCLGGDWRCDPGVWIYFLGFGSTLGFGGVRTGDVDDLHVCLLLTIALHCTLLHWWDSLYH